MINKIRINNKTRGLKQYNEVLGLLGENKYETLRFTFDEFIDGFATLIVKKHDTQGNLQNYFINLTKEDESYTLEVQNSLLDVAEEITMQLIVENENRLIFKTLPFKMEVLEAMEAEQEIPEQYSTWSELLVQKFLQVDNKLAEVTTLEEDLENKRDTGYWNGTNGQNGIDGQDGHTPIKGTDYWTNADKAEIVQDTIQGLQATLSSNLQTAKDYTDNQIARDFKNISYDNATATFVFTRHDNTTFTVDLPIEQTVKNGYYDDTTEELVLVLVSNQEIRIPASGLIDDYSGQTSATIQCSISADNKITCNIVSGSISKTLLTSELQTEINNKATKEYVDNLFNSIIDGDEVSY